MLTSKHFCSTRVSLLFGPDLIIQGVSQRMTFQLSRDSGLKISLLIAETEPTASALEYRGEQYLEHDGDRETGRDPALIEALVRGYVRFSGRNFPHILVPLMREHRVMDQYPAPAGECYESMWGTAGAVEPAIAGAGIGEQPPGGPGQAR